MVNDFISTIKESHFKTLREKYEIPDHIPLRLPYKSEKCYYEGVEGIKVYDQIMKAGLRFPLSALHRRLLQYLGLVVTQISLNAWRVFLNVEVLYEAISKGACKLMVEEFFHCYRPIEIIQSKGMYSLCPGACCWGSCATPRTLTETGKVVIFSWRVMSGCVTLVTKTFMPVNKTWGIMPSSSMYPSVFKFLIMLTYSLLNRLLLQPGTIHKSPLSNGGFWRKFLTKLSCQRERGLS